MKHLAIKMHGPEHHYLVPAVLLTAYFNITSQTDLIEKKLFQAEKRAKNVLGGFCGFYGNCGAAVGTGIFMSLVTDTKPVSKEFWGGCNLITSNALKSIGIAGGPRCCKRDSFIAIKEAIDFIRKTFNVELELPSNIYCEFSHLNKECLKQDCSFYNN